MDQNGKYMYSDSATSFPETSPRQITVIVQRCMCKDVHRRWFIMETMAYN